MINIMEQFQTGATLVELLITDDQEAKVCVSPSKLSVPDIIILCLHKGEN